MIAILNGWEGIFEWDIARREALHQDDLLPGLPCNEYLLGHFLDHQREQQNNSTQILHCIAHLHLKRE